MSSHYLDFSSCGIVPGFCKSGHIYFGLWIKHRLKESVSQDIFQVLAYLLQWDKTGQF